MKVYEYLVLLFLASAYLCAPCLGQEVVPGTEYASVADIPRAPGGEARATYDSVTGGLYVTVADGVLVFNLVDLPLILGNRNNDTPLGGFEQGDGLGQLDFGGLPVGGPYFLGNLLPADASIKTASDFAAKYPEGIFRSGAPGVPEVRSRFNVIPVAIPEPGSGMLWLLASTAWIRRRR
jgi:hypothetical protein